MKNLVGHLRSIWGHYKGRTRKPRSFMEIFRHFKEVLASNNRALEIITDMGEKLSGDYLFDINYVKSSYSELSSAVSGSIEIFEYLTQNKYPKLKDVFNRIDKQITMLTYDIVSTSGEMVIFYDDITWDMAHNVGGKNANLAELKYYLKLNVPAAFAITTNAFDKFIKHNRLDQKIEALSGENAEIGPRLNELQDSIVGSEFPPDLDAAIKAAAAKIKTLCGENCFLAIRSSAEEEDSEFSFAGQFETYLNVPAEELQIKEAYKHVVASLFSIKAFAYLNQFGYDIRKFKMATACVAMVDAVSSGVIYSSDPAGDRDTLIINAAWGLGESVVEGQTDADFYLIKKDSNPQIIDMRPGRKEYMVINLAGGGTEKVKTPEEMINSPCLTTEQVIELTKEAVSIEKHFRKPQDIEWAVNKDGNVFILQARPLRIQENTKSGVKPLTLPPDLNKVLMKNSGTVVQKGIGAGRVYILKHMDELDNFPKGSILVSKYDSSGFVRVMPYVSAIITDIGTPTSHMASLCREFKVPSVVGTGNATQVLKHGQEITLNADDGNISVYDGIIKELLESTDMNTSKIENIYEYRKKKYVLRYISPLNLIDPLLEEFTSERCKTMHDVLRFMHEKSVMELVDMARYGSGMLHDHGAVKLDLPIPAGIIVIDTGGGLSIEAGSDKATFEQITSVPFKSLVKGMLYPGVWHSDAVALRTGDFLSSMMRMTDITSDSSSLVSYNVAVVSGEYVNLSLRFGYHFNMIDSFCSDNPKNNHIFFRFTGGATDITKRSRRIQLLADVLKEYGFNINIKGDLIIARLANITKEDMEEVLDQAGRLIAYTRQLDALLHDDSTVERYARKFINGDYEL